MTILPLCRLHLALPLRRNQIHGFRGAVAEAVGLENDLFHNHSRQSAGGSRQSVPEMTEMELLNATNGHEHNMTKEAAPDCPLPTVKLPTEELYYRYPLIQYKVLHGQALIVGLGKGATALRSFIDEDGLLLAGQFPIQQRVDENFQLGMTEEMRPYYLEQWLALNQTNYGRWMEMEHPVSRKIELERILVAHILSFAAGVGFTIPRPRGLVVELHEAAPPRRVRCHDGQLISFDVRFSANINLPFDVGIGKSASHGFGCVWHDQKAATMVGQAQRGEPHRDKPQRGKPHGGKQAKDAFQWEW